MAEALRAQDKGYIFTFDDGRKISRVDLVNLILDTIGDDKLNTTQISNKIGMNYQSVFSVIRTLVTSEMLISEKMHRFTSYKKPMKCHLTNFFNHAKVLDNLKVNSSKKHKMEDFPNVSYGGTKGYEGWSNLASNAIYEG